MYREPTLRSRRTPTYVNRILKGAKPWGLPTEQPAAGGQVLKFGIQPRQRLLARRELRRSMHEIKT